jgi:prepilin-type N-terminal cleavage/methylation domain-containing protein
MKKTTKLHFAEAAAFTLVELLVVIGIIGGLAALTFPVMKRAMNAGGEAKMISAMRQVVQANTLFSAENSGQIMTLKYGGDKTITGGWVTGTFWGRLYPYLSGAPSISDQKELSAQIKKVINNLYGQDPSTMKGTPFYGPRIYHDTSGLPVPFAFNKYLTRWDNWVTQPQVGRIASTIFMTYGRNVFDEADAAQYTELPKNGAQPVNDIFYLPPNKTIAGFLDGRVAYITAPIPQSMFNFEAASP